MSLHHTKEDEWLDRLADQADQAEGSWLIYRCGDDDYYLARSAEDVISLRDSEVDEIPGVTVVEELTSIQLEVLKYVDEDGSGGRIERTFAEELSRRIKAGIKAPELFASSEW